MTMFKNYLYYLQKGNYTLYNYVPIPNINVI